MAHTAYQWHAAPDAAQISWAAKMVGTATTRKTLVRALRAYRLAITDAVRARACGRWQAAHSAATVAQAQRAQVAYLLAVGARRSK